MADTFTVFGKFGDAMLFLDEHDQMLLSYAVMRYGCFGETVELPPHLAMAFTLMSEDIDNSKTARESGRRGGTSKRTRARQGKAPMPPAPEDPCDGAGSTLGDVAEGPLRESGKAPSVNCGRGLGEKPEAKPSQSIPTQDKPDKDPVPYDGIVKALNDATGKSFRATSEKTRRLIHARWAEGYRMDDFLAVISTKASQWGRDPRMGDYLRPETLFGTKFEGYLQAAKAARGVTDGYDEYD